MSPRPKFEFAPILLSNIIISSLTCEISEGFLLLTIAITVMLRLGLLSKTQKNVKDKLWVKQVNLGLFLD